MSMSKDCRRGMECWKRNCTLSHPLARHLCPKAEHCQDPECVWVHPPRCKCGDGCKNLFCEYRHVAETVCYSGPVTHLEAVIIIGPASSNLKALRQYATVKVSPPMPNGADRTLSIEGSREQVQKAWEEVLKSLDAAKVDLTPIKSRFLLTFKPAPPPAIPKPTPPPSEVTPSAPKPTMQPKKPSTPCQAQTSPAPNEPPIPAHSQAAAAVSLSVPLTLDQANTLIGKRGVTFKRLSQFAKITITPFGKHLPKDVPRQLTIKGSRDEVQRVVEEANRYIASSEPRVPDLDTGLFNWKAEREETCDQNPSPPQDTALPNPTEVSSQPLDPPLPNPKDMTLADVKAEIEQRGGKDAAASMKRISELRALLEQLRAGKVDFLPDPWTALDSKANVTCMVVGETGAGKSTFINTLTNFLGRGSIDSLKIAIPTKFHPATEGFAHTERDVKDTSKSCTDGCTTYTFREPGGDRTFKIIDTPGLSDTRGHTQDDANIDKILKAAEDAGSLSSIIMVVNGAHSRYTSAVQNCMVRLSNALPDLFAKNTVVVFTHCRFRSRCLYPADKLPFAPLPEASMFYMENTIFAVDPKAITSKDRDTYRAEWDESMREMMRLSERVAKLGDASTLILGEVRQNREKLKAALCDMRLRMGQLQQAHEQIDEVEEAMKAASAEESQFADFTTTRTVKETKMVEVDHHNTICGTCRHVCHDRCGLDEIKERGNPLFKHCVAFKRNENCTRCPGKCSFTDHFHDNKVFVEEERTLDVVLEDIKFRYDAAVQQRDEAQAKIVDLASARQAVEDSIAALVARLEDNCRTIRTHCPRFNLAAELRVVVRQLEGDLQRLDNLKAIETAEGFIKSVRGIIDASVAHGRGTGV